MRLEINDKNIIITDRYGDTTFTDCLVIESTDELSSNQIKKQLIDDYAKATKCTSVLTFSNGQAKVIKKFNEVENELESMIKFRKRGLFDTLHIDEVEEILEKLRS